MYDLHAEALPGYTCQADPPPRTKIARGSPLRTCLPLSLLEMPILWLFWAVDGVSLIVFGSHREGVSGPFTAPGRILARPITLLV